MLWCHGTMISANFCGSEGVVVLDLSGCFCVGESKIVLCVVVGCNKVVGVKIVLESCRSSKISGCEFGKMDRGSFLGCPLRGMRSTSRRALIFGGGV